MPDKKKSRTVSVVAVVVVLVAVIWIAIPHLRSLRNLGYIDSAIGTVRVLVTEENNYARSHPRQGYSCALTDLTSNDLLRELAKSGRRNGYAFELICPAEPGTSPRQSFQITARPLRAELPAYCSDQSGILKSDDGGSPTNCLSRG